MQDYDLNTITIVNQLFQDLFAIKPAFKTAFPDHDHLLTAKRQWMLALQENGVNSIERLKRGLKRLRSQPSPFFPSPGEFLQFCKILPEDINAPTIDDAYYEATLHQHPAGHNPIWSHAVVKHAAHRTTSMQFLNGKADDTYKKFKEHYLQVCQEYADGKISKLLNHDDQELEIKEKPRIGQHRFVRPGILKIYENIKKRAQCVEECRKLLNMDKDWLLNAVKYLSI